MISEVNATKASLAATRAELRVTSRQLNNSTELAELRLKSIATNEVSSATLMIAEHRCSEMERACISAVSEAEKWKSVAEREQQAAWDAVSVINNPFLAVFRNTLSTQYTLYVIISVLFLYTNTTLSLFSILHLTSHRVKL